MKILSIRPSRTWQQANPPAPPVGNTAPVAINATYNATEGGTANVNLAATDAEGNGLTYTVLTQPTKGTLSGTAPSLIYTPTAGQYGVDSFTFKANDGMADSNVATVTVNVSGGAYASSVTQHGITWTFDQPYQVGQYCNGDWWVVGPIVLLGPVSELATDPTKNITGGINGTMVNPVPTIGIKSTHGFDYRIATAFYKDNPYYSAEKNIGLQMPYSVAAGSSVLSCLSYLPAVRNGRQLEHMACLTVVDSPPPEGSFRPTYFGSGNKTPTHNKSQIDYTKLQTLPTISSANLAFNETRVARAMFNLGDLFSNNYLIAINNTPHIKSNYGREVLVGFSIAALEMNLNHTDAQKEKIVIGMVQQGLDYWSGIAQGLRFKANGGQVYGHKLPVAIAGRVLNDAAILSLLPRAANGGVFADDITHYYVTQQDIDTARYVGSDPTRPVLPFPQESLGMPEWGADGGYPKNTGGYNFFDLSYRTSIGPGTVAMALAAQLSGVRSPWACEQMFEYADVYYRIDSSRAADNALRIRIFVRDMWEAYRDTVGYPYPSTASTTWRLDVTPP